MIAAELTPIFNGMLGLGLAIARIYPCVLLTPLFAFSALKGMIRTAVVVPLALFVTPTIVPMLTHAPHTPWGIVAMMLKEVVLGIFLGYLLALPFWLFESVGVLFDNQRGALSGGQLNPALGADETPLGYMLSQWSMMVLIVNFGLSLATQVIWDSYRLWPVDSWLPDFREQGFLVFLGQVKQMFIDTILYAGPLVLLLLFLDFAVGVLSIYSPQLQATVLTVPLKCIAGLLFFIFYLPTLEYFAGHQFSSLRNMIPHLADILPARQTTW